MSLNCVIATLAVHCAAQSSLLYVHHQFYKCPVPKQKLKQEGVW